MSVIAKGAVLAAVLLATSGAASLAAAPKHYRNCTALNKDYPHGVGRPGARDKTSGTPVTNFKVSGSLYNANDGGAGEHDLDRDNDGIACEKR
jgi:hypothetical protein